MKKVFAFTFTVLLLVSLIGFSHAQEMRGDPGYIGDDESDDQSGSGDPVGSFEACVRAGNLVMESYPRQCRSHTGIVYTEIIDVDVETDEQRLQRMLLAFEPGMYIPRIGFYFADGVDKDEAQEILARYGLELRRIQYCDSGPVVSEPSGVSGSAGSGVVSVEAETSVLSAGGPQKADSPAVGVDEGMDVDYSGGPRDMKQVKVVATGEGCEEQDDWRKIVPTDKEYFGTVEVKQGTARRLAGLIVKSESGVIWAEPDMDTALGSMDVDELNKKQPGETKEARLTRMLDSFDDENRKREMIIVSFGDGVTEDEVTRILARNGANFIDWEPLAKYATAVVATGSEKEVAENLFSEEDVLWVEPDYMYEGAETGNRKAPEDAGFFSGIWNWFKGIFG